MHVCVHANVFIHVNVCSRVYVYIYMCVSRRICKCGCMSMCTSLNIF